MKDPVCKMEIGETGIKAEYKNQTFYFCSENCKAQFIIEPKKFIK